MKSALVMMPILPGKLDAWKSMINENTSAFTTTEGKALLAKGGLERVRLWHAKAPDGGDIGIILHEGPDPDRWMPTVMESNDPLAVRFREQAADIHGFTPEMAAKAPPPPALIADHSV